VSHKEKGTLKSSSPTMHWAQEDEAPAPRCWNVRNPPGPGGFWCWGPDLTVVWCCVWMGDGNPGATVRVQASASKRWKEVGLFK